MMTDGASRSSSAAPLGGDLAVLAVVGVVGRAASMPKPPAITEMNERFIALHMM